MPGYSEGSRGLSVLSQVTRIFTGTTISPRLSLRQWGSRYTIRAGRNLPDKEFRYLRTVIVTAAVYRGFDSELRIAANKSSLPSGTGQVSDPILHLPILQSPVFLVNSRYPHLCAPSLLRAPLSRSYRSMLPSSLTRVISSTLVFSTGLPVSVCGTVELP